MDIAKIAQTRYSTKAFDPKASLSPEQMAAIRTLLRFSPSSINSQPWHFILVKSDAWREKVATATEPNQSYNTPKLRHSSLVVVFCAKTDMSEEHLNALIAQEDKDGRYPTKEAKEAQIKARRHYRELHRFDKKDTQFWMEKQIYIALGAFLLGLSAMGIDACPIEGFDMNKMDAVLGLRERGLTSVVTVALGKRSNEDFNAKLPKSRFEEEVIFTEL